IEDREEIFPALRQAEQDKGFAGEVGKPRGSPARQPVARREHCVEWNFTQRLEQDVRAEIEIVGERDLGMAGSQPFQNALDVRFVESDARLGELLGKAA